jgi:hypothetical protein
MRTPVETQGLRSGYVNARTRRVLAEGDGSKLDFRDENPGIVLWLDSSVITTGARASFPFGRIHLGNVYILFVYVLFLNGFVDL